MEIRLLIIAVLAVLSMGFSLSLDRAEPYCFGVVANVSDTIAFNYHIAGKKERAFKYEVSKLDSKILTGV